MVCDKTFSVGGEKKLPLVMLFCFANGVELKLCSQITTNNCCKVEQNFQKIVYHMNINQFISCVLLKCILTMTKKNFCLQ